MNRKNKTTEYWYCPEPENFYQTGSTNPPKSHGGLVAILLALVILLCGIITILSLMNINLLQQLSLKTEEDSSVAFRATESVAPVSSQPISGQSLPPFWQDYYQLPQGVYITKSNPASPLCPGDIILNINGAPVNGWEDFSRQMSAFAPGEQVTLTIFRSGRQQELTVTITD